MTTSQHPKRPHYSCLCQENMGQCYRSEYAWLWNNTRVIRVRLNIACMLAFLDMDYWTVPTAPLTSWNRKRVQSYLHRVREDIAKELIVTDEATLLDRSFQPNASRHWAVRVHHGLGHSNTGRTMYNEHCKVNGLIPYMEDFVNYGLHHSLPMIHAD